MKMRKFQQQYISEMVSLLENQKGKYVVMIQIVILSGLGRLMRPKLSNFYMIIKIG